MCSSNSIAEIGDILISLSLQVPNPTLPEPFSDHWTNGRLFSRSRWATRRELRRGGRSHEVHRRRRRGLDDRRQLQQLGQRQVFQTRRRTRVQLPGEGAHCDGGEPDQLRQLQRQQPAEQRQRGIDHHQALLPGHALLHLHHPRPLQQRHEARRERQR
uniref:Uncharacterized protein n=1 Tax=Oryza glumipatula TaxID=40148 RepID=A0A0E0B440_9ORYZ